MPIANCFVASDCPLGSGDLIKFWATESGQSPDHMTVNIIESYQQLGNKYFVMVNLFLPSVWSSSDISSLQLGLSKALEKYFNIVASQIHIVTNIIHSGMAVEAGQEITW